METLTNELYHWPWLGKKCESKGNVIVSVWPYSEIHKERVRNLESEQCTFFLKEKPSTRDFIRKVQPLYYPTVKKFNAEALLLHLTNIFNLGFKHIEVNVQNLIFLFY